MRTLRVRYRLVSAVGLALLALGFGLATVARADDVVAPAGDVTSDGGVSLVVSPSTLHLRDGGTRTVVVLRNGSTDPIDHVQITAIANAGSACVAQGVVAAGADGCAAASGPGTAISVLPGSDYVWTLSVTGLDALAGVHVDVTVVFDTRIAANRITHVRTAEVDLPAVAPTAPPTPSPSPTDPPVLATATLNSGIAVLSEQRQGSIFITVQNTAKEKITSVSITPHIPPSNLTVAPQTELDETAIDPGDERTYEFLVTAERQLSPGKEILVFDVTAHGDDRTFSALVTKEIQFGVLGESELTQLLGVPLLLVAPGFAFLAALFATLKVGKFGVTWSDTDKRILLASVPLSLLFVVLYGFIEGGDLLLAYSVRDIAKLVGAAMILGLVVAAIWIGCVTVWRERKRREMEFSSTDSPLTALQKLERRRLTLGLPKVHWSDLLTAEDVFVPEDRAPATADGAWVLPMILVSYPANSGDELRRNKRLVEGLLVQSGDPGALARRLLEAQREGASVSWKQGRVFRPQRYTGSWTILAPDVLAAVAMT